MAKRVIVKVPDEILFKRSREVEKFDDRLHTLLDDMKETLISADGAGLAGPQVAVLKRVALVNTDDGFFELINPVVEKQSGEQTGIEGCLSVPGKYGDVVRPEKITVTFCDRYGKKQKAKVKGFTARAFMHEIDHLDGIVYTSKCEKILDETD